VSRWRVLQLQRPEWWHIAAALVGAAASGVVQPVFGLIYSQFITVFFDPSDDTLRAKSAQYCGAFVGIACATFVATTLRIGMFSLVGERLTRRLRVLAYTAVLRQPMAFFDAPENSSGRLNTRLSSDAAIVKSGTGETVGQFWQAGAAILAAAVIAFEASWRLALVLLAVMPLQVLGAAYGNISFVGWGVGASKALEEAGHAAVEAMAGLRTISAFGLQASTLAAFSQALQAPLYAGTRRAWVAGASAGFAGFMMFSVCVAWACARAPTRASKVLITFAPHLPNFAHTHTPPPPSTQLRRGLLRGGAVHPHGPAGLFLTDARVPGGHHGLPSRGQRNGVGARPGQGRRSHAQHLCACGQAQRH
jgi:ATP-binding cassette subfamily B (MDR/TAP) protein 1